MRSPTRRTTIYLEPAMHALLQQRAAANSLSVSALINDILRVELAEEVEDLADIEARRHEPTMSCATFIKRLKRAGTI